MQLHVLPLYQLQSVPAPDGAEWSVGGGWTPGMLAYHHHHQSQQTHTPHQCRFVTVAPGVGGRCIPKGDTGTHQRWPYGLNQEGEVLLQQLLNCDNAFVKGEGHN
jgi:hypothetical protein